MATVELLAQAAVGRAVIAAQVFETVLIPIFEFYKMQTVSGYLATTGGAIGDDKWRRTFVSTVTEVLSKRGSIASDLEARLSEYVDDRNVLVHRWIRLHGWPDENDNEGFRPIIELANRVEREARQLTRQLAGYVIRYGAPDWAASHEEEYKASMAAIFQRFHLDH